MSKSIVTLYSSNCATCVSLFPSHPKCKAYTECHYKQGNKNCPAKSVKFVVQPDKNSKIENIKKCLREDDIQGAVEILKRMVKLDPETRKGLLSQILKGEPDD